jgi:hypothetical protein
LLPVDAIRESAVHRRFRQQMLLLKRLDPH